METEKWPKAADTPLPAFIQNKQIFYILIHHIVFILNFGILCSNW